ncbi:TonB-dependent receptor [Sphingomonas aerophila]|uniref:Iron complex outermembrane receptor protein n=1 Tax=Sphingomonas aerophila TaxID=1344948 RepID=A0A7W9BHB4_9SPHN|nr:TonB-dependent receptor [Sphingomonas aerophila]MBB5716954.1 iron complex outermembrane receptor protein [Sphingomonas aerophila]
MKTHARSIALLLASVADATLSASPVFAQSEAAAPASAAGSADGSDTSQAKTDAPQDEGEVIVTARRRQERAQDVPIAISVVSGATIERTGRTNLLQIAELTPSLAIRSNNARNTFANIRGLGSNSDQNDGLEVGVGFYVDDVYYGRIGAAQFDLIDLDRVEVLRGPQGTLFGKNTTAGAINITTRAPSFQPEARAEISLGERGYHQARASASGPLIDGLAAFRITVSDTHSDGLLRNAFNGRKINNYDASTVRAQLLLTPAPDLTVRLIGDYSRQAAYSRASSIAGVFTRYENGAAISNNFNDRVARAGYKLPYDPADPFARVVDVNADVQANMKGYGVSGKLDWNLGSATLTSVSAYRWWDWYPLNDQDNTSLSINIRGGTTNRQRQFSQEIRLGSNGSNTIDYTIGAYYFWQVIHALGQYQLGPAYALWNNPTANRALANLAFTGFESDSTIEPRTKSYAAFGQATWNVSKRLALTSGLRFTHEDKSGLFDQRTVTGNSLDGLSTAERATAQALRDGVYPQVRYVVDTSSDALTGQVTAGYHPIEDVLLYATYSRGSKSGGLSLGSLPTGVSPVVKPETVNAYEVGLKSQFLRRRVSLNAAAFQTDVKNYQAAITEYIGNTTSFRRYISNIPGVRSRGVEADLIVTPSRALNLTASAAYVDAVYQGYTNAQNAPERRNLGEVQDLSGVQLANAPKFTYTLAADLTEPLGVNGDEIYGRVDFNHRSSYDTSGLNSAYTLIRPYGVINARIGFRLQDSRFDLSFWARNLTDKQYFTALSAANNGLVTGNVGDPRTIGATFRTIF